MSERKKFTNNYNIPNIDKVRDLKDEENIKKKNKNKHPDIKSFMEIAEELNPDDFE